MLYYNAVKERTVELNDAEYARLADSKKAVLKPYRVQEQPVPNSTQVVRQGPVVVSETEAVLTWIVEEKSPEQLLEEQLQMQDQTEREWLKQARQGLKNADGNTAARLARIERCLLHFIRNEIKELN